MAQCKGCGGSGNCSRCHGKGSVMGSSTLTTHKCEKCGGSGNCTVCGGSGKS